jgi:hypothetical protein
MKREKEGRRSGKAIIRRRRLVRKFEGSREGGREREREREREAEGKSIRTLV